jgi:aryl-alcohol dehydrogenase-like predicted oxidoreductase
MERRLLGRTGAELSIVGFGGVALVKTTQSEADAMVGEVIDQGVNYFDVAPSYGTDQETEIRLGGALEGKRDGVFIACKTGKRTKAEAEAELHRSLKHLRTDYFDLYQLHAITTLEEMETVFAPGGAMEVLLEAKEKGLVKNLGFSAHSVEAAFYAMDHYDFASALFPINFVTFYQGNFGPQIITRAQDKGVGRLALKAMARTHWKPDATRDYPHCWYEPLTDPHWAEMALRFTLSQPITAAVPPGDPRLVRWAVEFAQRFRPISTEEVAELEEYARSLQPIFSYSA